MTSVNPTIGMPLEEIMKGNRMSLIGANGAPFAEPVLKAAGMDISVMAGNKTAGQALSSDISSLVLDQRNKPTTTPSMG